MKKLIGLKGGNGSEFFEIIASEEIGLAKYPSIKDGKEIPHELGMSAIEHAEWKANKHKVAYSGYRLTVNGNPLCAEAVLRQMGYNVFSSTPTTVGIYDKRGGKRAGAGRPVTGRTQRNLQANDDEWEQILKYANMVRGK